MSRAFRVIPRCKCTIKRPGQPLDLFLGGLLRRIMNGRGQLRRARPGAAAPTRPEHPAWSYLMVSAVSTSPGGYKLITEKTTAAAAAADAGVVFYKYGGHRHQLFAVRAGNNFLRCTDAEGGRGWSEATLQCGQQAAHKEVMSMINTSCLLEQSYGARRAGACEPLPSGKHGRPRGVADRAASR